MASSCGVVATVDVVLNEVLVVDGAADDVAMSVLAVEWSVLFRGGEVFSGVVAAVVVFTVVVGFAGEVVGAISVGRCIDT